jgi:tetratricopeptide (TPR) repeat protein
VVRRDAERRSQLAVLLAVVLAAVSWGLLSSVALAQSAAAHVARARAAEESFQLDRAAEAYRAGIEAEPSSRAAHVARRRLAWLEERAEGGFGPLVALERARRATTLDRTAFEATVDAMPRGLVRRESLELLASAHAAVGDTAAAERALRQWLAEASAPSERERATAILARLVSVEEPEEAERLLEAADLGESDTAREIDFERQVRVARPLALGALGLAALMMSIAAGTRWASLENLRALARPGTLLLGFWLAGAPLLVAMRYDPSTQDTFVRLAASMLGLFVIAQLVARALRGAARWRRAVAACAVLVAHVAMGYLVLLASGTTLGILGP